MPLLQLLEDLDGEHGGLIGVHGKQAAGPKDEAGCVFSGARGRGTLERAGAIETVFESEAS